MIDLIDLTSPTYKEELAVTDKILATDGNNVFMVSPSGTDSETVDTMQKGIMAFDSEGKKGKLNVVGFLSEYLGIENGISFPFFTKNPYSKLKMTDVVDAMVEKGYIPEPLSFNNLTASFVDETCVKVDAEIKDNDKFLISAMNDSSSFFFNFFETFIMINGEIRKVDPYGVGDYNMEDFGISIIGDDSIAISFNIKSKADPWPGSPDYVSCIVNFLMDRSIESKADIEA